MTSCYSETSLSANLLNYHESPYYGAAMVVKLPFNFANHGKNNNNNT